MIWGWNSLIILSIHFRHGKPYLISYPLFLIRDESGVWTKDQDHEPLHLSVLEIHNPRFFFAEARDGLSNTAQSCAHCISKRTNGLYLLGGWFFGGIVAFEVTRQVLKRSLFFRGIVLIDAPRPILKLGWANRSSCIGEDQDRTGQHRKADYTAGKTLAVFVF